MGFFKGKGIVSLKDKHWTVKYGDEVYEIPYDDEGIEYAVHEYASLLGRSRLFDYYNDRLIAIHVKVNDKLFCVALDNTKFEWNGVCEKRVVRYSYKPNVLVDLETWQTLMERFRISCYEEKGIMK